MNRRLISLAMALAAVLTAGAMWPFSSEDKEKEKPRLHMLIAVANDYIEEAEVNVSNGELDKGIESYKKALEELARVARENPERAESAEFAPLRNKIVTITAAIDSIRFAQVNANVRAVAVSDTTELEKRYERELHGTGDAAAETAEDDSRKQKNGSLSYRDQMTMASHLIAAGDLKGAAAIIDELLKGKPSDLKLLMMKASVQYGLGDKDKSKETLESAVKFHPESYLPYYNLANLVLVTKDDKKFAREYYEQGKAVGGPANQKLESVLYE